MNIFYVDRNPGEAAKALGDRHVLKMILETAQLLDTAQSTSVVRRPANVFNHPCAKWVRQNKVHYMWLYQHFVSLVDEYSFRFGKVHAYEKFIAPLKEVSLPIVKWSDPPCVMPFLYHHKAPSKDPVMAYRHYYNEAKRLEHRYTKRNPPTWLDVLN